MMVSIGINFWQCLIGVERTDCLYGDHGALEMTTWHLHFLIVTLRVSFVKEYVDPE